ncbi:tetraspanin-8-like [Lycodopsis pacificus]
MKQDSDATSPGSALTQQRPRRHRTVPPRINTRKPAQNFECCGLIEGYKDWGSSIPASCNCHYPGKCIRLRGSATLGAPKNQYVYQEPCLPVYFSELKLAFSLAMAVQFGSGVFWVVLLVMSIKLMGQIKRKQEFIALLQSNRYIPGAF